MKTLISALVAGLFAASAFAADPAAPVSETTTHHTDAKKHAIHKKHHKATHHTEHKTTDHKTMEHKTMDHPKTESMKDHKTDEVMPAAPAK